MKNNLLKTTHLRKFDLMEIGVKIFGLYYLLVLILTLKSLVILWISEMSFAAEFDSRSGMPASMVIPYFFSVLIDGLIAWFFLFRSQAITKAILKSDADREGEFSVDRKSIVQISAIVIGGLIVTGAIESLGLRLISIHQASKENILLHPNAIPELIWECVYGIIGYALITGSGTIANRVFGERKKNSSEASVPFSAFPQWKIGPVRMNVKRPIKPKRRSEQKP